MRLPALPDASPGTPADPPLRVIAVTSNTGGVGKTTLAVNLAVYARALREDWVQPWDLAPLYLRKPDAEINWTTREAG